MSVQLVLGWTGAGKIEKDVDRTVLCICETNEKPPGLRPFLSGCPFAQEAGVVAALDRK